MYIMLLHMEALACLIKSKQTAGRETEAFSCQEYMNHTRGSKMTALIWTHDIYK